mmetsp:Transcript_12638/g.29149  ORF Transcript_12638/g.29149 Transcript_12638/m.29149 type:complete len:285 (+) Transcript_12638:176-1030(+)
MQAIASAPWISAGRACDGSPPRNPIVSAPLRRVNKRAPARAACFTNPPLFNPASWVSMPPSDSSWARFRSSMASSTFLVSALTRSSIFFMLPWAISIRFSFSSIFSRVFLEFRSACSLASSACSMRISSSSSNKSSLALSKIFSISDMISLLSKKASLASATSTLLSCCFASWRASLMALSMNFWVSTVGIPLASPLSTISISISRSLLKSAAISSSSEDAASISDAMSRKSSTSDSGVLVAAPPPSCARMSFRSSPSIAFAKALSFSFGFPLGRSGAFSSPND